MSDPDTSATIEWDFELPSLGADMDMGTVVKWYVKTGDPVLRGDLVARVETEKSDIDVEIWQPGTVTETLVDIGQEIPVGTPMLRLSAEEHAEHPGPEQPEQPEQPEHDETSAEMPVSEKPKPRRDDAASGLLASPMARSVALERGIDLRSMSGSGPDGAILIRDLDQVEENERSEPEHSKPEPADRMRQAIAERMAKANQEIPHYHLELDVEMGPTLEWIEQQNAELSPPQRILPAALFIKATAAAAAEQRALNGFWVDGQFRPGDGVHVAVAVSLRKGGLVTPVVGDADQQTVTHTMATLKELVTGARSGSLRSSWMSGATITITNLGDNGADKVHGVIFPPQVALVGFGRIRERPWIVGDQVVRRPVVTVTLSGDHRATDGATGSRFLSALSRRLRNPEEL